MNWLIVNGDDFGISPGINRGIMRAHRDGILTSASLLVDRPACEEAVALGSACPRLSLGLHLELDAHDLERVPVALERQLARFLALVGAPPTHVDSHHDVHQDRHVLPHVLAWAREVGVPLRGHSRVHRFSKFYGAWGGETHLEQIGVDGFLHLLDAELREGVTELICHPGYVDAELSSSYAAEREVELATLCDDRVRRGIRERAIRLIGFRDLPALAATAAPDAGP
jgi:chitin disaccharide deacetylase